MKTQNIAKEIIKQSVADVETAIKKIERLTDQNYHTESVLELAKLVEDKRNENVLKHIKGIHNVLGHMPYNLSLFRGEILKELEEEAKKRFGPVIADRIHGAF